MPPVLASRFFTTSATWEAHESLYLFFRNWRNSQSNLEKEDWNWRNKPAWLKAILLLLLLSHFSRVWLCAMQPTRLPSPWDAPGKNTGVGCHFLLKWMKVKSENEVTQSCPTLRDHGLQPSRLLHPWDFPGKNTRVGCNAFSRLIWIIHKHSCCIGCPTFPNY